MYVYNSTLSEWKGKGDCLKPDIGWCSCHLWCRSAFPRRWSPVQSCSFWFLFLWSTAARIENHVQNMWRLNQDWQIRTWLLLKNSLVSAGYTTCIVDTVCSTCRRYLQMKVSASSDPSVIGHWPFGGAHWALLRSWTKATEIFLADGQNVFCFNSTTTL